MSRRLLTRSAALALAVVVAGPAAARAQTGIRIEVHGGGGITSVDVQQASGQSGTVSNESTGMYQFFGRVFFLRLGSAMLGAELGYQYLYYYEAPFGSFTVYRDVDATRFAGVASLSLARGLAVEGGAGVYSFESGSVVSVFGAVGYDFNVAPKVAIPVRARVDALFDDPVTIPIGATIGLALKL